ncbi:MAG TPA: DUF58 domain-containing protein [Candidatus Binatia bacterium]|nr:DUF58 domain-containing protein [Candidatus Binatia bacterium]
MRPFFKVLYRVYRLFSWVRYRAGRRLTKPGLVLLGALVLAGLMGPDTDDSVTYQGFALLLFLLAVAVCFSAFFRAPLSPTRLLPRFGTVGCPLHYAVVLKNHSAKTQRDLTLLEDLADPRPTFEEWLAVQRGDNREFRSFRVATRHRSKPFRTAAVKAAPVPEAAPHEQIEAQVEVTPWRRGPLRFEGVTLARPDALGLFRAFARIPLPQTVLVLPRRYPLPPLGLPGTLKYQQGGVALAANVGQSDEFVALRDYRPGDPVRHIHWRSWARAGKPVVKEFEDEFFVRHALVLDTFTEHPNSELFEEAVSVAASFACAIQTQESLLDLLFVGPHSYCFTAGRGLAHGDQMLEILASVRACPEQSFRTLEHLVLNHVEAVSGCICVLVAWDQERQSLVQKLLALDIPLLVAVLVEPGAKEPLDPGPMREQPEKFHVLQLGQVEQGLARMT